MAWIVAADNASSTLASDLTAGALSIALVAGASFPAIGPYIVTVCKSDGTVLEKILIDSKTSNTLTVNAAGRGYGGTAAAAHSSGDKCYVGSIKHIIDQLQTEMDNRVQPFYGVSWDESADTYARTGFTAGQPNAVTLADALLPIQRRMRRCLLSDAGVVNYYLSATDSTKKEDGTTASVLTGADGQVMVEIPRFYYRYGYSGTIHTWEISPVPLAGFAIHPAFLSGTTELSYVYIGAYEGVLYDTSITAYVSGLYQTAVSAVFATSDDSITIATRVGWATNLIVGQKISVSGTTTNDGVFTVASVVDGTKITVAENLTDQTAAATIIEVVTDVTATTGDKLSSVSGFAPITGCIANGTRAHFRTYAANRGTGWSQEFADVRSAVQLLYLTEYASFYSQSVIGAGISNVADWAAYNDYNPITKTGLGNAIGNGTGTNAAAASTSAATVAASGYLSYRGIENPFGHLWKWLDGFNINNNIPYLCNNPTNFADDTTSNYTRPVDVLGAAITMHNADGYQATLAKCGRAFMPASVGASGSTKVTDYYYQAAGWRVACSGGAAYHGAHDGCFDLYANCASANLNRHIGARLVFRK